MYRAQMPRLYNFFRYRLGDNQLAQDLTASTFEKAWRSRELYRADVGAFTGWLFTIARNLAMDYFRQKRPAPFPIEEAYDVASDSNLEEDFDKRRQFAQLMTLLRVLPADEQELIALKYGAGMTNRDIAKQTQYSESNVGTRLHRLLKKLRIELEDSYD